MAPNDGGREISLLPSSLKRCYLKRGFFPGWDQLPEDVIVDILCLLPVKNLMQCKCVCKEWHQMISYVCVPRISSMLPPIAGFLYRVKGATDDLSKSAIFMDYVSFDDPHNLAEASKHPGMLEEGETIGGFVGRYSSLLPFVPSPDDLLDLCQGLLLFVSWCASSGSQYYVCNPTTNQCVGIPKANFDMEENCYASLAFNPCESPHYKVVRFPSQPDNSIHTHQILDVFSSETGLWARHEIMNEPSSSIIDVHSMARRTCYLEGVLHRLSTSGRLFCYNIRKMTSQIVDLPRKGMSFLHGFIGVSKGRVHYANRRQTEILVWVLNDSATFSEGSGDTWIPKHSIPVCGLISHSPPEPPSAVLLFNPRVFAIHPTHDIFYIGNSYAIYSHHLGSNSLHAKHGFPAYRHSEIVSCQKYSFLHSVCYVTLNGFNKTVSY